MTYIFQIDAKAIQYDISSCFDLILRLNRVM